MIEGDQIKQIIAAKALEYVYSGMRVGIGSGTTAQVFIRLLGQKVQEGFKIEAIAASKESEKLALEYKIPLNPLLTECDIYIDGTDEFDDDKNCLKGKGRALFREKIIASMSKHVIIMAEAAKKSTQLFKAPLVCEILPFGFEATIQHIHQLGFKGFIRRDEKGHPVITDNQNYLFDIELQEPIYNPQKTHLALKHITGVLETGLFFHIVNKIIVGVKEGQAIIYE